MNAHYRVVVIGGGVVGASVLYHLTKFGWTDVALVERSVLTAGSSWHAAGGFHALNANPNMALLQAYTIDLLKEVEAESGQPVGMHMTGGIHVASAPERWEWLQSSYRRFQAIGIDDVRLVTPEEIKARCPIINVEGVLGGMWADREGYVDTTGAVWAYAGAAKKRGATVIEHNRVLELKQRPDSSWDLITETGVINAEHVVNAAGLWAKQVGRMVGLDLPLSPLEHHYLLTETIPEIAGFEAELPMVVDLEGFTYMRQDQKGMLVGIYETNPQHWSMDGAPWDYGIELLQENIDRIAAELELVHRRYPVLQTAGIRKWVNGAFTFSPDGNPLVGPVAGKPGYWLACGVMAGFLQGGGVGKSLAELMIHGEAEADVYGLDIARYGPFASNREYIKQTTGEFYARRFVMTYPNEQLPAGRPLKMTPAYDAMTAAGCRWGNSWGLEVPLYFAPAEFEEKPTLKRSNAFDIVSAECRVVREGVGLLDIASFSRYEVTGPEAESWLDWMTVSQLPKPGRARLAPMLSETGKLKGDLTIINWGDGTFWIEGSYYLRQWHMRWFAAHAREGVERARYLRRCDRLLAVWPEIARPARARHASGRVQRGPPLHGRGEARCRPCAGEGRATLRDRRARLRDQLPRARARRPAPDPARSGTRPRHQGVRLQRASVAETREELRRLVGGIHARSYAAHDRHGSLDRLGQGRVPRPQGGARREQGTTARTPNCDARGRRGRRGRDRLRAGLAIGRHGRLRDLGRLWPYDTQEPGDGFGRAGSRRDRLRAQRAYRRRRAQSARHRALAIRSSR